jgi:hypothetical protein
MSEAPKQKSIHEICGTIRHLDAARARALVAAVSRPCGLDGPGSEDDVVAETRGRVTLRCGVAADDVACWKTNLHLHGLLRLPLSVARELATHPGNLFLDKVASITEAVAEALGQHAGGCLSLDNVRMISWRAAGSLGRHAGDLSLNGLTRLHQTVALGLAQHAGELWLNGLAELEPLSAAMIARHRGHLHLNGLTSLSERVVIHLSGYPGRLHLHGVARLSDEAAAAFGSRTGHLCLPGVVRLSPRQVESLSRHRGALHLDRLGIDDAAAEALGRHHGSLYVGVSDDIDNQRLEAVVRHQGPLEIAGLTRLDESQARVLASQAGPRGIQGLSCLFIDTVRHLNPAVASILATHSGGGLCLTDIQELGSDVARELVRHPLLCLDSLARLTDEVAAVLATHTGSTLSLRGLRDVSPRAVAMLKATPSVELPPRLATSSDSTVSTGPDRNRSVPGTGLHGDGLIHLLRSIVEQGELVLRRAIDHPDDTP